MPNFGAQVLIRKNWMPHKFDCTGNTIPRGIAAMDSYYKHRIHSCIRGHHIYKDIWQPVVGETLECMREARNTKDRYAVAVVKSTASATGFSTSVVGHLPKKMSHLSSLFLRRGGLISCEVTGARRHSWDLPQGGLEVPCTVIYRSTDVKELDKIKSLMSKIR